MQRKITDPVPSTVTTTSVAGAGQPDLMGNMTKMKVEEKDATPLPDTGKNPAQVATKNNAGEKPKKLSATEKKALEKCERTIQRCQADGAGDFQELAQACYQVQHDELYREHSSQAAFFKSRFGFSRSHSLRLAQMGGLLERVSPTGDTVQLLATDAHLRPLLNLAEKQQDAVITKALDWAKMAKLVSYPAKLMAAAKTFLNPPKPASEPKDSARSKWTDQVLQAVEAAKSGLPKDVGGEVKKIFDGLLQAVKKNGAVRRSTGIAWTEATWNPLHGCTRESKGCDNCYAAKLTSTRLADVYPGLAVKKTAADGKTTYAFTGKIQLLPADLADPLHDQIPKMYFVNSMSDLFHPQVPDGFIEAVFEVMEKAHWHTFQVLTKRPERMAAFTKKRYAVKAPSAHIWLGTSTEDQAAYDERMPHLKKTKAAIRWLSAEPLLGPIKFESMTDIDWVVVGGESGSDRQMKKEWAVEIRDACKKADVPFFFKQWGEFNEQGKKKPKAKGPAKLDGKIHHQYPEE
jgi:protein gp37